MGWEVPALDEEAPNELISQALRELPEKLEAAPARSSGRSGAASPAEIGRTAREPKPFWIMFSPAVQKTITVTRCEFRCSLADRHHIRNEASALQRCDPCAYGRWGLVRGRGFLRRADLRQGHGPL